LTTALELGKALDPSAAATELSDLHYLVGVYLFSTRQPGRDRSYEEALRLNPNNVDALSAYAGYLYGHKRAPEADGYYRKAIERDRQSLFRYVDYAVYLGTTDEVDKLHDLGREIERLFPNTSGYRALARLYELTGELDIGIAWGLKAYDLEPVVETKRQIAELYARIGDFETAKRWEPEPGLGQLWLQRRYDELVETGEVVAFDNLNDVNTRYLVGFAHNATGDFNTALPWLERIAASLRSETFQGPIDPQAVASYVDAMQAVGIDDAGATSIAQERADWLTAALENGTEHSWWENTLLACAQVQLGNRAAALDTLERVVESHGLVWSPLLLDSPCFKRLADEPRYQKVVERIEERKRELRERLPATLTAHGVTEVVPR
jgi:tetratricopeptide (TPR) repeat protein